MDIAGVDGCRSGWLCVRNREGDIQAEVFPNFGQLLKLLPGTTVIAIDIPIGLPTAGERACDRMARKALGAPRSSSVFPAPIWAVMDEIDYVVACSKHRDTDGRALSKHAFAILPKIAEVNRLILNDETLQGRVREIHPELCFTGVEWRSANATSQERRRRCH